MAFSAGNKSTEGAERKLYIGVGSVSVLAINPNKAEINKLTGRDLEEEPEYLNKVTTGEDNHEVENVRLDFYVKIDDKKHGLDETKPQKIAFFVRNEPRFNRDKSKVQVIDKYGRTCWATIEQAKAHEIPTYSNGPANIDKDYRPCFYGEEELTNFIKNYLCIPNVMKYVNGTWVMNDNPQDSEARLESIAKYFKNDFSELKSIIKMQPENKVKVMFGVRSTDDNKQYQTAYTQMTLKNSMSDYSRLDKDLQERKNNGAFANTEYEVADIHEYNNTPTDLSGANNADPFAPAGGSAETPWFN